MKDWRACLDASPYLTKLQSNLSIQHPEQVSAQELAHQCDALIAANEPDLIQAKIDFDYCWSRAFIGQHLDHAQLGLWRSNFADTTIQSALRLAWQKIIRKNKALAHLPESGEVEGLYVFAMGKLGGRDLNFSSDVDLLAFFDPQRLAVPNAMGKSYVAHQVLQVFNQLLSGQDKRNFVWRVDWRLRPNASATSLAMSCEVAREYYFYRASPWHRLALLKARFVAGDQELANEFLAELSPFIWRRNLDYRALDELAEIKQRINLEHPGLRAQRQWVEPISDDIAGFNLKLGSGGIREIEFIVNAHQLLWGGRDHRLRTTNTLEALSALASSNRLDTATAQTLAPAYTFLRQLENAVQLRDNQHDHLLPGADSLQNAILTLTDFDSWQQLAEQLNHHRQLVNQIFQGLFAEQVSQQGEIISWPSPLSDAAQEVIENWEAGFVAYGVSQAVRFRLKPLRAGLAEYLQQIKETDGDVSEIVIALHHFFNSLPSGEQYFRLLAESPQLLENMVQPLMHSPPMAILLKQSPHIVDCFLQAHWQWPDPFETDIVEQANSYEARLEGLRRFVNEYLYQLYLALLQARLSITELQTALTKLAQQTLELSLTVVAHELGFAKVPVAVIGMGKLGLQKMSPQSDLDLIFVFDEQQVSLEQASKFVSRLQTAIATPMREGIVYELDTRLRPSGRAGVPTVSAISFDKHHMSRAHSWEHLALMPSRVVAGNMALSAAIDKVKKKILRSPRDQQQAINDIHKMWARIEEHRIQTTDPNTINTKLRAGGLMQAEFLASALVLVRGGELDDLASLDFDQGLQAVLHEHEQDLSEIISFWRALQCWERLLGLTGQPCDVIPASFQSALLHALELKSFDALISKQKQYQARVLELAKEFFQDSELSDSSMLDAWQETKVQWLAKA